MHAARRGGFGAGGLSVAYDSLWLEVLSVSGILGLLAAAVALVMLTWRWARLRYCLAVPEWHLAGGVLVLAIAASAGIPSLTANRACTLQWLVLGVLICPATLRNHEPRARPLDP